MFCAIIMIASAITRAPEAIKMKDVLVRDVEDDVLEKIKHLAKRDNRSLQSMMKKMMKELAEQAEPLSELELIRKIRFSNTKVNKTDSVDLIREDRSR